MLESKESKETVHEIFYLFTGRLLNVVPYSKTPITLSLKDGLELLGLKWLPSLSRSQAREVTPYEVGDRPWKQSIHTLTSGKYVFVLTLSTLSNFMDSSIHGLD